MPHSWGMSPCPEPYDDQNPVLTWSTQNHATDSKDGRTLLALVLTFTYPALIVAHIKGLVFWLGVNG